MLLTPNIFTRDNDNNNFIYASAPNRGLEIVLKAWPFIKKALPDAKLEVFMGFKSFIKFGRIQCQI